jgi:cytochrome bd ubiquinol oxidase subunit II
MFLQSLPMVFILAGLTLYTVLGGADLGAGFWQLATVRRSNAPSIRDFAHRAMGPVWEANHVWLVFVLTVFWTSYPKAFGSIMSTLAVPLFIALLGILLRGVSYAMREGAATPRESGRIDTRFALSSILVPFTLGAAIGGIATNRVPVGNAAGDMWSSWLNPTSIVIGTIAVATSAYLAAVYLAADAAHDRELTLERSFRVRALGAGVIAGTIAIAGMFVVNGDDHALVHSLLHGRALPAVITSGLAGVATLLLVYRRRYELARYAASLAVATVVVAWALSRWPTILPGLSVHQAAAGHDTLVCVVVAVLGGAVLLFPALALLFRLTVAGRFRDPERFFSERGTTTRRKVNTRLLGRLAVACLIAGFGLLNIADAPWAHAIGVTCLFGFVGLAFRAIVLPSLDEQAATR